ncbi:CPCC family cysteine-rich protein [Acetivibrio thermocellus]|uniref:CPCC family cysteine-rich protein n=1 Tax=Acetivibrio thermocellus TaxID=1515 RepID=UPI0001B1EF88|nr:CPCC family cysteine-rich protein [Acetivibrio thermocellus]UWV47189.1 CPCC family cysteine-rich protein [Acetivibrio thermocellus]
MNKLDFMEVVRLSSEVTKKYPCPCCGYKTFISPPPNTFDICPVCYWEDDGVQYAKPDYANGANKISLNEAKANFVKYGAILKEYSNKTRKPLNDEM